MMRSSGRTNLIMWAMSIGIIVFFAASAMFLEHKGRESRKYTGPALVLAAGAPLTVNVVETSRELYNFYKEKQVHGRILVHIGSHLHAIGIDSDKLLPADGEYPPSLSGMMAMYEKNISYRNVLWVAMQANFVREVYYIEPAEVFRKRREEVDDRYPDFISKDKDTIVVHQWGSRMTISDRPPDIREPVLLNIDAAGFSEFNPDELLHLLQSSSIKADLITVNLSRDNPDVNGNCRDSLLLFARRLQEGGPAR